MKTPWLRKNSQIIYTFLWIAIIINIVYLFYILLPNSTENPVEIPVTQAPVVHPSEAPATPSGTEEAILKHILRCTDKYQGPFIEQRGPYMVYYNYIRASKSFPCHGSVTLTTHGEPTFVLDNLETLVERWRGPISLAVFTLREDYDVALQVINYLRECKSDLIKQLVTFHFIFQEKYFPNTILKPSNISALHVGCGGGVEHLLKRKSFRSGANVTYQVNVARNAARKAATTYFIMPSDIELYPSYNFTERFLRFIEENPGYVNRQPVGVFVLPIFEVAQNISVPKNKTELVNLLNNGSAVVFHESTCPQCQLIPGMESWKRAEEGDSLSVIASSKRQLRFRRWEPIYVGTHKEPYYDERLSWEGTKDKMGQMYLLCLMNYDFFVLDNAFLVHRPGIKSKDEGKKEDVWRKSFIDPQVQLVDNEIKEEYDKVYGARQGCIM